MKSVYLAGPISGLTFDDAQDWRGHAATFLASRGVVGLSPLREKHKLTGGLDPNTLVDFGNGFRVVGK